MAKNVINITRTNSVYDAGRFDYVYGTIGDVVGTVVTLPVFQNGRHHLCYTRPAGGLV